MTSYIGPPKPFCQLELQENFVIDDEGVEFEGQRFILRRDKFPAFDFPKKHEYRAGSIRRQQEKLDQMNSPREMGDQATRLYLCDVRFHLTKCGSIIHFFAESSSHRASGWAS